MTAATLSAYSPNHLSPAHKLGLAAALAPWGFSLSFTMNSMSLDVIALGGAAIATVMAIASAPGAIRRGGRAPMATMAVFIAAMVQVARGLCIF